MGNAGGDREHTTVGQALDAPVRGRLTVLVIGDGTMATFPLPDAGEVTIGRASGNAIAIDEPQVSRRHAVLRVGDDVHLVDLHSRHGTRLGERRLEPNTPTVVRPGDVIHVGPTLLVVQAGLAPDRSRRPATPAADPVEPETVLTPTLRRLDPVLERIARSPINVLILGETGVGKEIFAERIHELSERRDEPLLRVNCAALTESLLESELFGHEKGAFTGADANKPGLLERADGGTVFLDEVGELPASIQAKLLRLLEDRTIRPVGGLEPRAIDVRFVAATNRDLQSAVSNGTFRSDLFFRLNGISVGIPSLRERADEIPQLARAFVSEFARRSGRRAPALSNRAMAQLTAYSWPGNVRELRNVMQRAVLLCDDEILPEHLSYAELTSSRSAAGSAADTGAGEAAGPSEEERRIREALEQCGGNQTRAARLLGISRRTLGVKIDRYGLPRPRRRRKG